MASYLKSTTYTRMFKLIQSADHLSKLTGATATVNIGKAGAALGAAAGTVTEVGSGWYKVALTTVDTNTAGDLAFYITAASADDTDFVDQVTDPTVANAGVNVVNWNGTVVATPATAGIPDVNTKNINNVSTASVTTIKAVQGLTTADTIATYTGNTPQTGDGFARMGAPAGASIAADLAEIEGETDALVTGVVVTTNNDKTGYALTQAFPTNFSSTSIDTNGRVKVQGPINKNVAFPSFTFIMTDATTHAPKTGCTVTGTVKLDAGSFGALTNAVVEVANGWYVVSLAAADVNGGNVSLNFTAVGADDTKVSFQTVA